MSLKIVKHRKALRDLLESYVYIGTDNLDAAERFLRAVNEDVQKLAEMPGMGTAREFKPAKLRGIRSLPVTGFLNWLIFYRVSQNELQMLRVFHGARDIERALQE